MQELKRLKPYKNTDPAQTIHRIRQILFDNGIFVIESSQKKDPLTGICSCRIILGDEGLRELNIGSNGKGMNTRYALASAYAEFAERLQNGALLWKVLGIPDSMPGAVSATPAELEAAVTHLLTLTYGDSVQTRRIAQAYIENAPGHKSVTFEAYPAKAPVSFPVYLLNKMTGSNGMAAGNTVPEAILQGLSEIFERAAITRLFLEPLTPPEIEEAWFEGTRVLAQLRQLRQKGLSYRILDCSLGQGLPVIGLLLEKQQTYHIHFGADPSPITALERCLTESLQGRTPETLPLYPPLQETSDQRILFENEKKEYTDSTGQVPPWLIHGVPSWEFGGFEHPVTISDEDDLDYYLSILDRMGKQLYVRQTGALGFPTVRLFVPGMTENHCPTPEHCLDKKIPPQILAPLRQLPLLSDDQFHRLASSLAKWLLEAYQIRDTEDFFVRDLPALQEAFPAGTFPGRFWDTRLLIAAIYLRGGLTEQGSRLLERYLEETDTSVHEAEILRLRLRSRSMTFIPTEWPQCPDCNQCRARSRCRRDEIALLQEKLTKQLSL